MKQHNSFVPAIEPMQDDLSTFARYGGPEPVTIGDRIAVGVGHIISGACAVSLVGGLIVAGYTIYYSIVGTTTPWIIGGSLVAVFLITVGVVGLWRTLLDEWRMSHDKRKWDALKKMLIDLKAQIAAHTQALAELEEQHATELVSAAKSYHELEERLRERSAEVNLLRTRIAAESRHGSVMFVGSRETDVQKAMREIARAFEMGTSYSRDAICAGGHVQQAAWAEAMETLSNANLAIQARKGGPWKIEAVSASTLLAAVGLTPLLDPASNE